MCGLVGFTEPGRDALGFVAEMLGSIAYRGPDQRNYFVDDNIAVGHARLSVIDLAGGRQPKVSGVGCDLLVFNGEIYNYRDLAKDLRQRGLRLQDNSDTEVLFQMLRTFGVSETVRRLDGMFAFVYRDGATGKISLVRDRFGEKPLYFAVAGQTLVFASEIKAILRHPMWTNCELNFNGILQYLSLDYIPAPETAYAGIQKACPGEILTFFKGQVTREKYFKVSPPSAGGSVFTGGEVEAINKLDGLLEQAVSSRLIADVPVGLFLSGGLDSALISAYAARVTPDLQAFTIKFSGQGYDESPYAVRIAEQLNLRHVVREFSDDELMEALDVIEENADEPFADSSIIPTYLLCKLAKERVTVALGGDGGDELFAGYVNFQALMAAPMLANVPLTLGRWIKSLINHLPTSDGYMGLAFKLGQLGHGLSQPPELQPFLWMAPFDPDTLRQLLITGGSDQVAENGFAAIRNCLKVSSPHIPIERLQYLFSALYLPDDILTKVDRSSMYNSLEVRAPFLYSPLAEFALSLPPSLKIRGLNGKYLLKQLAYKRLPRDVVDRPKHGFAVPITELIRGSLRSRISETLLDETNPVADWFSRPKIAEMLNEHMTRRRDHRKRLWSLYCLFRFTKPRDSST